MVELIVMKPVSYFCWRERNASEADATGVVLEEHADHPLVLRLVIHSQFKAAVTRETAVAVATVSPRLHRDEATDLGAGHTITEEKRV